MQLLRAILLLIASMFVMNVSAETTHSESSQTQNAPQHQQQSKHLQDFHSRSKNIQSLLHAYHNIATEMGKTGELSHIENQVTAAIQHAKHQYLNNNDASGRLILDQTYKLAKMAIVDLRDGKTLVKNRSKDEQYEVISSNLPKKSDREKLNISIDTLLTAYKRVSVEKDQQKLASVLEGNINAIKSSAENKYQAADHDAGNQLLKGAYTLIKEALTSLRDGETLVQSLNFANDEEEYQYYVRKTDSQKSAIQILLKINNSPSKTKILNNLLNSAQNRLDEAGVLAGENKFDDAIPIMDKAFTSLQSGLMMSLSARY